MFRAKRSAFTLFELMVVITILCIALALIPWSVLKQGDHRRRANCLNNQHQWDIAIANYVQNRRLYPGYRNRLDTDIGPVPVSWVVELLPYVEQTELADLWKRNPPGANVVGLQDPLTFPLSFAVCPNDPQDFVAGAQPLSYVVNAGLPDANPVGSGLNYPGDWPANGVFVSRWEGVPPVRPLATVAIDSIQDGLSNTLLLSENVDARYYYDNGTGLAPAGFPKQPPFNSPTTTPELYTTMVWHDEFDPDDPSTVHPAWRINGQPPFSGIAKDMNYARPTSNHSGFVVVTFCDGRSQALSATIDYKVYCLLMTSRGRKANPPGAPFATTEKLPAAIQASYEFSRKQVLETSKMQ